MPTRSLRLLALLLLAATATLHAQDLPDGDQGRPGPGPLHKVVLEAGDARVAGLQARGALVSRYDYGSFSLFQVDERRLDGRDGLERLALPLRDELDLMVFHGLLLDGRRPAETLARLNPDERLGAPEGGPLPTDAGLYLVQFVGPIQDAWLQRLVDVGAHPIQYAPSNAYVVEVDAGGVAALEGIALEEPGVQYAGPWQPAFRMAPEIRAAAADPIGGPRPVLVQVVGGRDERASLDFVASFAVDEPHVWRVGPYLNVAADIDPIFYRDLARHPRVFALEGRGPRVRHDERQGQIVAGNVTGSGPSSPGYLTWLAAAGFNAAQFGSFSVNVVDDATALVGHPDLPATRVAFTQNPSGQTGAQGGHGFLNAHIIGGFNAGTTSAVEDASGYNYGLGIAPWARVGATAIFGPANATPTGWENTAWANGARISSNSWGYDVYTYDANAQEIDFIVRDARGGVGGNQELTVVFSAGNDGPGLGTISSPATAKNAITVGASENERQTGFDGCGTGNSGANDYRDVIGFSSRGPVNVGGGDTRFKPELVAPGTHIQAGVPQSAYAGNSICDAFWPVGQTLYGWSSGTSHSCPAVAGGAALVRQRFLNEGRPAPSPAMTKAVLVGTTRYLTGVGAAGTLPGNAQGFGLMDLGRAFDGTATVLLDQTQVLASSGQQHVVTAQVADPTRPVRVALVWTDAPGIATGSPWVNDLDLQVTVGGSVYRGNVFAGATSVTGGSFDGRNNTECVFRPAGTTGTITVTVTAFNIAGDGVPGNGDATDQDFALVIYNATTGPAVPSADFVGTPVSGSAPLVVSFTDLSTGTVATRSWTFGDGGTSTSANPTRTYGSPGTYTVSLTVTGPAGSDTETKAGYVTVGAAPSPGIGDGSFEAQTTGAAPGGAWPVTFGAGHVIRPSGGPASDNGFPSDGGKWLDLAADSTNGATPPANPGGVTAPAVGGAGVAQSFSYPTGQTLLSFSAAFLRNESANQTTYNDWMSVDVSDGTTTRNLYYKDTFSATSGTSTQWGYAQTALQTVTANLATLFPGSTNATVFTLTAQVGNGSDNVQPSRGYLDHVRLTAPVVAPIAGFSGTPLSGTSPLAVLFTDASTGSVTSRSWSFGDGTTSTATNPTHTFTGAGTYTVALTVSGPGGTDSEVKSGYVTVSAPPLPPVADFSGTPTTGTAPITVTFTNLTTGSVTSRIWSFGDGTTSTATNPSHMYTAPGLYTVALTVTGPGGTDTEVKTGYVVVTAAPLAGLGDGSFEAQTPGAAPSGPWTTSGTGHVIHPNGASSDAGLPTAGSRWCEIAADATNGATPPANPGGITAPAVGGAGINQSFSYAAGQSQLSFAAAFLRNENANQGTYNDWMSVDVSDGATTRNLYYADTFTPTTGTSQLLGFPATPVAVVSVDLAALFATSTSSTVFTLTALVGNGADALQPSSGYVDAIQLGTSAAAAPTAEFSASATAIGAGAAVTFLSLATGTIASHSWSFGDGATSSAASPSHAYPLPGVYTVSLTVTGPGGADTETKVNYVTVTAPGAGQTLFVSFADATMVPGVGVVEDEDIVAYDTSTGTWSLYFDGSDVGLAGSDIDALHVFPSGEIAFSIDTPVYALPGLQLGPNGNLVTENDIIYFLPTATGLNTAGTHFFLFDGSDVGLDSSAEDIDALYFTPNADVIALSCTGTPDVLPGLADEDVLFFQVGSFFTNTTGSWFHGFDGSDVGLTGADEDVDALEFDAFLGLNFSTEGAFGVGTATGTARDVARYSGAYGPATAGTVALVLDLGAFGIGASANVDGMTIRLNP